MSAGFIRAFALAGMIGWTGYASGDDAHTTASLNAPEKITDIDQSDFTHGPEFIQYGEKTKRLKGHKDFCLREPWECNSKATHFAVVGMDKFSLLEEINNEANQYIKGVTDFDMLGVNEHWDHPLIINGEIVADCEDIVIYKKGELVRRGIPFEAISYAMVKQSNGAGHLVLVVRMEKGDYVLDNLERDIRLAAETTEYYAYVKATSFTENAVWQEVTVTPLVIAPLPMDLPASRLAELKAS